MFGYALFGLELIVWVVFLVLFNTVSADNLLLSMSFIAFMMSAGRIINAVTEFLSGFIIDRTHTLSLGKYDAQAANNGIAQFLSPCLLKDADMQSFLWSVAFC